ncbi:uncharacterized protein LOC135843448 isoform X2 [Planococcus citri]|uniref:uncharacterized protein LOC135843448 isoform X2 n=2 Tax=Planococcus citri TaxID=170843 RepID=UPI0031F915AE
MFKLEAYGTDCRLESLERAQNDVIVVLLILMWLVMTPDYQNIRLEQPLYYRTSLGRSMKMDNFRVAVKMNRAPISLILLKKLVTKKKKVPSNSIQNLYKVIRQYEALIDNYTKRINEIEDKLVQHNTLENKVLIMKKMIEIETQYRSHVTKYLGYRERLNTMRLDEFRKKLNTINQPITLSSHTNQNVDVTTLEFEHTYGTGKENSGTEETDDEDDQKSENN